MTDETKPAKHDKAEKAKARPDVLIVINTLGPYRCSHNVPGGSVVGGGEAGKGDGIRGMVTTEILCWPGANLRPADHVDLIRDNHGFRGRLEKRSIEIIPNGWAS